MTKAKTTPTNKDEAAAVEKREPNHTEKIKSQVLAKIGHSTLYRWRRPSLIH